MDEWMATPVPDGPRAAHGEGPVWDPARQCLWWVDLTAGVVHRARIVDGGVQHERSYAVGGTVGAVLPATAGGCVLAADDGFIHLAEDGTLRALLTLSTERRGVTRMNDAGCDPDGRLLSGSMGLDAGPGLGSFYVTDLAGGTRRVLTGLTVANGVGFGPDGATCYLVDSGPGTVWAFDYADGVLGERRPLVVVDGPAVPDGLCVDDEGCLWVALWAGGEVRRYGPDGEHLGTVRLPVSRPSSVAFCGADRDLLVVSTSRQGLDAAHLGREPSAGRLFTVDVGVRGLAANPFRGPVTGWRELPPLTGDR